MSKIRKKIEDQAEAVVQLLAQARPEKELDEIEATERAYYRMLDGETPAETFNALMERPELWRDRKVG